MKRKRNRRLKRNWWGYPKLKTYLVHVSFMDSQFYRIVAAHNVQEAAFNAGAVISGQGYNIYTITRSKSMKIHVERQTRQVPGLLPPKLDAKTPPNSTSREAVKITQTLPLKSPHIRAEG